VHQNLAKNSEDSVRRVVLSGNLEFLRTITRKAGDDTWRLVISTRLGMARHAFPVTWETGGGVLCLDTVQGTVSVPGGFDSLEPGLLLSLRTNATSIRANKHGISRDVNCNHRQYPHHQRV
jgi:hypothetical protein